MTQRQLTREEREQIYIMKLKGESLWSIAGQLKISNECARKWWRRGKKDGLAGLGVRKRGRPKQGILSKFEQEVCQASVILKRQHKRWGAARVLLEMSNTVELARHKLPSRSRLHQYFREYCPDCLNIWTKYIIVPRPARATAVHEVWQLDHQEGHRLEDGNIATVCNIRDPYGAVMIASEAFEVKTEKHWRKLTWEEVRQVLR